jgi:hypothetical protein
LLHFNALGELHLEARTTKDNILSFTSSYEKVVLEDALVATKVCQSFKGIEGSGGQPFGKGG